MTEIDWLARAIEEWPITLALAVVFLALLLWICMPFAVFGLKRRLDRMASSLDELVELMKKRSDN